MSTIGICTFIMGPNFIWDENDYYNTDKIGYAERWIIKISEELAKKGNKVYVFGNPEKDHTSESGVKYFKLEYLFKNVTALEFDTFITSRFLFEQLPLVNALKKILILQEDLIVGCSNVNDILACGIKSIGYMSEFQKNIVQKKYAIPDSMFFKTSYGFDVEKYELNDIKKENRMVFSGEKKDGIYLFSEKVFPKIKEQVPDFELDIVTLEDYNELAFKKDGIKIFKGLSNDEKIELQKSSKIWVYANNGYDTNFDKNNSMFCFGAIENALAKNACIMSRWGSCYDIFKNYKWFVCDDIIEDFTESVDYEKLDSFFEEMANEAIKCLKDESHRLEVADSGYKEAIKYTWENACNSILDESKKENEYEKSSKLRVMLCCIGRLENNYIREFVEYYRIIGVDKICLFDNNMSGEDNFHDVIGDYIDSGYVILKDYRDKKPPVQFKAYNECYEEYKNYYDWFLFFDIDEFMFINQDGNIKSYLSRSMFNNYNGIYINWLNFGDCDNVKSDGRPILERLSTPLDINSTTDYNFPDNFHIKSIVRGGLDSMKFTNTAHRPEITGKTCNATGLECGSDSLFLPYDYRFAGLRHFTTKTADEFANKVNRGFCDTNKRSKKSLIEQFFKRNKVTKEKVDIFNEKCGVDVSYLLPVVFTGKKNDDVKIYTLCYDKKNFQFLNDAVITPLQVGSNSGKDVCELKDNTLDNIADKNYFFVENTGTYWIWKNVHGCKYKGQMQYRRPLSGVSDTMNFDDIFSKYDVITCKPFNHPENSKPTKEQPMCIPAQTVEEGYGFSNCLDDLLILEVIIKMAYPEYAEDYDKYIKKGENLYYSNGFILRAEDYDRYAEFMYDCLCHYLKFAHINSQEDLINRVKYNLEVGKYIRYKTQEEIHNETVIKWQSEIGGFLSERIWTLWLLHNFSHDKIYELPYIKMEEKMYT